MKQQIRKIVALSLICLGASLTSSRGQVVANPNTLSGTVRFNNSNPSILNLLRAPGNEGFTNLYVTAVSLPPAAAITANSGTLVATNRLVNSYALTVDSSNPGIAYGVTPYVTLGLAHEIYYFNTLTSAPVVIGTTPPALDFTECVGVVTVRFVTSTGVPIAVDGGEILATDLASQAYTGDKYEIAPGSTQQRMYLRGTQTHQLDITIHRGTNFYTDRIEHMFVTNVLVTCDQFKVVDMVIPSAGTLARITGTVDILGEFEESVDGNDLLNNPDYTSVVANNGPFANQRWDALEGVNFTTPSSGTYLLSNMVPSTLDPLSVGYVIYAQTLLRTNRAVQIFITPALGWGANPAVPVTPGANIDLSNTFVIQPGFIGGQVQLKGPAESLGRTSLFRGLLHAGDDDLDFDGIPDYAGTYGIYWSSIAAQGVDRLAPGATLTASHGYSYGDFDGAFNSGSSAYEGSYQLVAGGLKSEPTIWQEKTLSLTLTSGVVTNDDDYYFNALSVTDQRTNDFEVDAGQTTSADVKYCFSEVLVRFRAASGTIWNPSVLYSTGTLQGTNFLGEASDYFVYLNSAVGKPDTQAAATNSGVVVMYLPEGNYTLNPYITSGDSDQGLTGLQPIQITVGCGQRIAVEPCLQVHLTAPPCSPIPLVPISGSVASCTNSVSQISYTLDSGSEQVVCNDCGLNPNFAFAVNLANECGDHVLTVTATDDTGGTSFVTTVLHYDATPPVIHCPTNLVASACDTNGAVVNFAVTATDNCVGPVIITCNPPSGSVFPLGVTTVTCVAADECGNTNQCSFTVTVGGSELAIERAVIIRWSCGGILQSADEIIGPWTDLPAATSPYATPTSEAKKFYRVRN